VKFSDHGPSTQWAALKYQGAKFAEVWFKPADDPHGLLIRIPQESFQIPGIGEQLTLANLLMAVNIVPAEVASWHLGDVLHAGINGANPEFATPLAPPQVSHIEIHVRMVPAGEGADSAPNWHELEACWKTILGLEASVDTLRISMESLRNELQSAWSKPLTMEEKTYAPRADVAQWTKAKNRIHNVLPKMRDFIHRATWALGAPERKRLDEIHKTHIQPHVPFPEMADVRRQLEDLRKDRQVLSAFGKQIFQECRAMAAQIHGTLRALQQNAAAAAHKKKGAG
jgi:hypothetical protein